MSLDQLDLSLRVPVTTLLLPLVGAGIMAWVLARSRDRQRRHVLDHVAELEDRNAIPADPASEQASAQAAPLVHTADAVPAAATGVDAAGTAGAEPASVEGPDLLLELDPRGRIVRCGGDAASLLSEYPDTLLGNSLLTLVPERIHKALVNAIRSARAEPGQELGLPTLRLKAPGSSDEASAAFKLTLNAAADGSVAVRGEVVNQARPAPPPLGTGDDRFSRVFHSSPDAILIIRNRDGVILDMNQGFTRQLGYTREQAIGQSVTDLALWVDENARRVTVEKFGRERNITDLEARLRDSTGKVVPVEISLRYIELDGDLCVLCIGRDISKRLEAESAARSSEEKFSQVFSQSPDGILIMSSPELVIRDVNPAFLDGSGYGADELVGQPVRQLEPDQDPQAFEEAFAVLARDGRVGNRELVLKTKAGHLPALVSAAVTEIDGEPSVLCIVKDVSELRHAQEQLRRSEERFRGAFENAPIGILLLDTQGHIFQANRFATELLHYSANTLGSTHVSRLVPSDDRAELKEQLARLIRSNDLTLRAERRMLCADGLEIWTNCHIVLQRGSDGEPLYCIMQIADITEMKTSQRRMEMLAFYDTLTELANRRLFNDRLQQAVEHCRRHDERAALLYLDLDQFKRVNDTLGHESGDALLREVADRLVGCVRKEDTVGRPGGDEFTILLYDIEAPEHAGQVAEKILRELQRPIMVSGHQLVVTTSIGITVVPDDGTEPNALMKNADLAMYRAKEKGRNNYQFYSEDLNTNAVHRLRTEYELRRALERSEFELHFQPMVGLSDLSIVGVECLLRWNHPERGSVPPDEFIAVAEETGAIVEIGNWVIEEACTAGQLIDRKSVV